MHLDSASQRRRPIAAQHSLDPLPTESVPLLVQNLSKRYRGGVWANWEINLTGNPGEILGILGPNGAGKTTMVRQITTELLPTSGSVKVLGYDVVHEPNYVKSLLGIVPQEAVLFNYLTVYQHLRIFANLRGLTPKESRKKAEQLIEDLDLIEHRDVPVSELSGGLKRRVLVGIASAARPPVMVLDEPTTGLDIHSRHNLWSLLRRSREEGAFILLTTHSMEEAETLCDRVGIIQDGRLLALDTVTKLRASHGFQFKVTYFLDESNQEGVTLYGSDDQELVAKVRNMGVQRFSIEPTTLEDVYLAITGETDGSDDREG